MIATPPASFASRSCSFSLSYSEVVSSIWARELGAAALDVFLLAGAVDNRGVVLVDADFLGPAERIERDRLELDAEVLADHLTAGQDREVFEHRLAAVAKARRLDRGHLEAAAQLVDDQRGQRLALDVLGDDQQRVAALHHRFQQREDHLQAGQLFLDSRM